MVALPIVVACGDGAGKKVIPAALRVLAEVAPDLTYEHTDIGAERYARDGVAMPPELMARLKAGMFAAILFGAVGAPLAMAKAVLLDTRQRQGLDLAVNVRPIRLVNVLDCPLKMVVDAAMVDFLIVRENTEGEYNDIGGMFAVGTPDEMWQGAIISTRKAVTRTLRYAFEQARKRRKILTLVDKSNAMPHGHGLWRKILDEIKGEYPDVKVNTMYFDIATLVMALQHPENFDVIVGSNLVGDVMSDLLCGLAGGLGYAPSANINLETGMGLFEPVAGTAPDKDPEDLNPISAVLSAAMMLHHLGRVEEANRIVAAVDACLMKRRVTKDMAGGTLTCDQATDAIIEELAAAA